MIAHHHGLIHHLHRLLPAASADSDVELLDLYVRLRDERAFATLVYRHGAMVLGVCNRIVGNLQTAEDAYQATFLALARHAGSIRRPAALAAWLYGTAQRIAWKACAAAARRTPVGLPSDAQTPADPRPDPLSQVTAREALAILDEEVQRLPEVYRVAVILCCLDGKTLEQAAQQLGCTTGALRGRLERGRARLHARLVGRGLTLATALATAELARGTAAGLAAATIRAALAFAANGTATAAISAEAARLAGEVAGCTAVTKAKLVAALLLVLGLATVGVSAATLSMFSDPPVQIMPAGEWAVLPDEPPDLHVDRLGDPLPPEAVGRIGSARLRTAGFIHCVTYSADGETIVCANFDWPLQFWDASTGKLRHSVRLGTSTDAAFVAPANRKVIHLFSKDTYLAFDTSSGKELRRLKVAMDGDLLYKRLAPDGSAVALAKSNGPIRLIDLASGEEKQRWIFKGINLALAFTPDGKTLLVGGDDGRIRLLDTATGNSQGEFTTGHKRVNHINISPDGGTLVAAGEYRGLVVPVVLWDLKAGKELCRIDEVGLRDVKCTAFSSDSRHVAIGSQWTHVGLYDAATGKETCRFRTWGTCFSLDFSRDGRTLLAGTREGQITQWDIGTGKALPASADPIGELEPVRFTDGGKHLLVLGDAHAVYDWKTGREVRRHAKAPADSPLASALSADGTLLSSPAADGKSVLVLESRTGKTVCSIAGYKEIVLMTLLSPDGKTVISSGSDRSLRLWDVASARQLHDFSGHQTTPISLSPDGRWLATVSQTESDLEPRIYEVATGKMVRVVTPRGGFLGKVAFSHAGKEIAVGGGPTRDRRNIRGDISLQDVRSGAEIKVFSGHTIWVTGMAFSPDGRTLASGGVDRTVRLWEIASGQERHRFAGHAAGPQGVVFSPDGRLLAASSADAPVLVWDVYGHSANKPPAAPASAEERQRLWQDLASPDAKLAFQAVRRLVRHPAPAVALLRDRLNPPEPADAKHVEQWLHDLDSDNFEVRQTAFAELEKLGDRVEVPLIQALRGKLALEPKRRVQALIDKLAAPAPERLARSRALEVLEQIATPEAVQLVETHAGGQPEARLTREAAETLDRIRKR